MFDVGDTVRIKEPPSEYLCMPNSPALNLIGTTAVVTTVVTYGTRISPNECFYKLKFLDVKAKDMSLYEQSQEKLNWRDRNLELIDTFIVTEVEENDFLNIFADE